jgi:UDP-3-O-[3-hydroxymyristoyl] N-acetylglucosamine deacetylase
MVRQHTLRQSVQATGVGMHSGKRVQLRLHPAPPNTGIVFRRVDVTDSAPIVVNAHTVGDTRMATSLGEGVAQVRTVEHLLSACAGLGVDNLHIDIDAEEVPILDGSAASFVYLLHEAGLAEQRVARRFLRVLKPVEVREGSGSQLKWARLEPHNGYRLRFEIEFDHPAISASGQSQSFDIDLDHYVRDIARSRTFGFVNELEWLRSKGLGLGGGLDNAIVMDESKVLNSGGLRNDSEFVKHKLLDAIGDMAVAGHPLLAAYSAYRGGHALNNQLLRKLLADPSQYDWVHRDAQGTAVAIEPLEMATA